MSKANTRKTQNCYVLVFHIMHKNLKFQASRNEKAPPHEYKYSTNINILHVHFNRYTPGLFEVLKYAWIQVCLLLFFEIWFLVRNRVGAGSPTSSALVTSTLICDFPTLPSPYYRGLVVNPPVALPR